MTKGSPVKYNNSNHTYGVESVKHLGKRLRELRVKNEMSQEDVARAIGVSPQAISKWETGKSDPDISNLISISSLFRVPVDELLDQESRYREWEAKWQAVVGSADGKKRLSVLKDAVAAFPGDFRFRYRLAAEEFFLAGEEAEEEIPENETLEQKVVRLEKENRQLQEKIKQQNKRQRDLWPKKKLQKSRQQKKMQKKLKKQKKKQKIK